MSPFAESNYETWKQELFDWQSVEAFESVDVLNPGIHRISMGKGPTLDVLLSGSLEEAPYELIPVFFNGAVMKREDKFSPFFSGKSIAEKVGSMYVAISDPSTALDQKLGLAWYAGNEFSDVVDATERVLRSLAKKSGRRLLLIGGSGGGFAALHFGGRLEGLANVIVWNPQTDIFEYSASFVRQFLAEAFPTSLKSTVLRADWVEESKDFLSTGGVRTELLTLPTRPGKMIIFQNESDWHVGAHLAPLLDAWEMRHQGHGIYRGNGDLFAIVANFGQGHATLPTDIIVSTMNALLKPQGSLENFVSSSEVIRNIRAADSRLLPRDLRSIRRAISDDLTLELDFLPNSILAINVDHTHSPVGIGRMKYRYFTEDANDVRTYRPMSMAATSKAHVSGFEQFAGVTLTDGFLNDFGELKSEIEWPESRVFILGSCVSRDTFEDPRSPQLVDYIARTSLASAFDERPRIRVDYSANPHSFQRRMVQTDVEKRLKSKLETSNFDILLLDLIDERLGLVQEAGGSYTRSPELRACNYIVNNSNVIPFGSPRYLDSFDAGLKELLRAVPADKIVVNEAYWAGLDLAGNVIEDPQIVAFNNDVLRKLYERLRVVDGVRFISHDPDVIRADPDHRWGLSPFHFGKAFESSLIAGLRIMATSNK